MERECPLPSIICRICDARLPAFNCDFHTILCERRRELIHIEGKRVADQLFYAYADLNDLVNNSRRKNRLQRSGSMLEGKTYDFDYRKPRRTAELSLSRSTSRVHSMELQHSESLARRVLLERSMQLDRGKKATTTGEMKLNLMKHLTQAMSSPRQPSTTSSRQLRRGWSHQQQPTPSLSQKRGFPNLRVNTTSDLENLEPMTALSPNKIAKSFLKRAPRRASSLSLENKVWAEESQLPPTQAEFLEDLEKSRASPHFLDQPVERGGMSDSSSVKNMIDHLHALEFKEEGEESEKAPPPPPPKEEEEEEEEEGSEKAR